MRPAGAEAADTRSGNLPPMACRRRPGGGWRTTQACRRRAAVLIAPGPLAEVDRLVHPLELIQIDDPACTIAVETSPPRLLRAFATSRRQGDARFE